MIWRISTWFLLVFLVSCKKDSKEKKNIVIDNAVAIESDYYSRKHLIECDELDEIVTNLNIKIIDFRKPEAFLKGHVEGAINIWRSDIENPSFPYRGMMASKKAIENLFSKLGVKTEDSLVIYDDNGACDASRLWWVLKTYGFENTKILNGGLSEWKKVIGKITTRVNQYQPTKFKLPIQNNRELYLSLDDMKAAIKTSKNHTILDTRTDDEFSGKRQKKNAKRGGRIPNSVQIDWANTIEYNTNKTFKTYNQLLSLYNLKNVTKNKSIYVYCHSGVRSAHTTFVLTELLGFKNVKNYDGSWIEWSFYEDLKIEKDSTTTLFK